jgi:5-formyltetrahydrofolate cyclo-ligase
MSLSKIEQSKHDVRQLVRQKLAAVSDREVRSLRIVEHLKDLLSGGFKVCGAFRPMLQSGQPVEPDIRALFDIGEGHTWAFPRIEGNDLQYWVPFGPMKIGPLGLEEPDPTMARAIQIQDLECVIVPGVAFDRSGQRLGRGKGYYDRALANFKGLKIGVCFSEQFLKNDLVVEPHDIAMNWVVTEKFVYKAL